MSFLCETPDPTSTPTTTTTIQQLPAYENEARQNLYGRATAAANEPYTPYGAQRLADFNPDQQAAFQGARDIQGQWNPALQQAYGATTGGATTFPQANLSAYMNPYQQQVTDIAAREATRNSAIRQKGIQDQFIRGGSFGGSRSGIAQAEENRNLGQQLDDIQMKGGQQAFTQAGQLFNADADRLLKAGSQYGTLATQQQGLGLRDLAAQQAVGEAQQGLDQKNYDLAYQNFLEQRNYPQQQSNFLANIIKGTSLPTGTTTTGQQFSQTASPIAQGAGLATTALGLYGLGKGVGWFAKGGRVGFADGGGVYTSEQLQKMAQDSSLPRPVQEGAMNELIKRRATGVVQGPAPHLSTAFANLGREANTQAAQVPAFDNTMPAPPQTFSAAANPTSGPLPPPEAPPVDEEPARPPTVPPGTGGRGAGQSRANAPQGATQGSFYEQVRDKIFGQDKPYEPLTKPIDVEAPKAPELDEKVSPWMAITRAGLGMMSAKPGQSALQAIGEGGTKGFEQLVDDTKTAAKNKQGNFENNLRQADFYIKKASTENDRLTKEKQLEFAQRQLRNAEGSLALQFAHGMSQEDYQRKSLAIQAMYAKASGGGGFSGQANEIEKRVRAANPGMSEADIQREVLGHITAKGTAALTNAEGRGVLTQAQLQAALQKMEDSPAGKIRMLGAKSPVEQQAIRDEWTREILRRKDTLTGTSEPVNPALQSLFAPKK